MLTGPAFFTFRISSDALQGTVRGSSYSVRGSSTQNHSIRGMSTRSRIPKNWKMNILKLGEICRHVSGCARRCSDFARSGRRHRAQSPLPRPDSSPVASQTLPTPLVSRAHTKRLLTGAWSGLAGARLSCTWAASHASLFQDQFSLLPCPKLHFLHFPISTEPR